MVSFSDSPLSTEEPAALTETRSAERRFAASSKELLVRALGAVEDRLDLLAGEVLDRQQVFHESASTGSEIVTWSTPSISSRRTLTRSSRAVGRFLPT